MATRSSSRNGVAGAATSCRLQREGRSDRPSVPGGWGGGGLGVAPTGLVEYGPADLAAGDDTMQRVAGELLADFPQKKVRDDPAEAGWNH